MKHSLRATAAAFGLAMLCGSVTWGCGETTNSVRQSKANQTATATPAAAFFTVRNYKVVATSATASGPAQASKRDSSLNHWQLE